MNPIPSIGSWVWGESGNVCPVIAIGTQRSTGQIMLKVDCPQGVKVIPLGEVKGSASDTIDHPEVGDRVHIAPVDAEGIVAQIDYDDRMARVNNIQGWRHPQTGYEVLSQWFPWACVQTIEEGRVTA